MAKILIGESESPEHAYKRFQRKVIKEGILSSSNSHSYFSSPSQKKRLKSKKAQKRQRKFAAKLRMFEPSPDYKDYTFHDQDTEWPVDLNPRTYHGPTAHVCVIAKYSKDDFHGVVIIKDENKEKHGFPGGGVKVNEDPKDGAVREYREETGLDIRRPEDSDVVFEVVIGDHRFICYASEVIGGEENSGDEIEEMRLVQVHGLKRMADLGGLLPNHSLSFAKYYEIFEGRKCTI